MPACTVALKVIPHASRDEVVGWQDGVLRVKVRAPALEGRANEALLGLLAARLGLPPRAVTLARGAKSRRKFVQVDGLDAAAVRARLGA